jgi:hypothetical protein
MRFGVGQKRTAVAAGNLSLALVAITVGMAAIAAAFFVSQGSSPATPNVHSSSSSLLSSSSVLSSSSSAAQPAAQASASQYPLVWAPNSPTEGGCDTFPFCIYVRLGFSGTATLPPSNQTSSATTVIQDNTTTIVFESTTTYMSGVSTGVVYPQENDSYLVAVFAFVQDAVTGQNITTSSGQSSIGGLCAIQPTGFTECVAGGGVPPGHTYKVTVYVTKGDLPCSIRPANHPDSVCSQLLAPVQTITVTE